MRASSSLLGCAATAALLGNSAVSAFTLTGDAIFVLPNTSTSAVSLALRDVQRDFYQVTGYVPFTQQTVPAAKSSPTGTVVVYFGSASSAPWLASTFTTFTSQCYTGWESHCVVAIPASSSPNGYDTLIATGTDDRGSIYGAYSFSELILNVNPWYQFTDDAPSYVGSIDVNSTYSAVFPPPQFKHRAWFPNDEDLLGGHRADPAGQAVFDLVMWDHLCETLLRLKGNGMLIGTNPFPDEDSVKLVARRGVVVQHHHYNLLGSSVYQWPMGSQDWDWEKNTATMAYVWQASIEAQKDYEIVWSVGLRGLNDYAYPCPDKVNCGLQISQAVGNQTKWVEEIAGPNATCVLYMWDEILDLLVGGYLVLPPNVQIIFADAGSGYILINSNVTKYANGVYIHSAMYNGQANQLTEMVPADRLFAQLGAFVKYANTTSFVVDNLSDVRQAPMTSEAILRLAWNPQVYTAQDPNTTARIFYQEWGMRQIHLSATDAQTYSDIWWDYFIIPFIQSGKADNLLADNVQSLGMDLAADMKSLHNVSAKTVATAAQILNGIGGVTTATLLQASWTNATALLAMVPPSRQPFYTAHSLVNMATNAVGALAVVNGAQAINYVYQGDIASAISVLGAALAAFDQLFALRRQGEYGAWAGFWFTDHLSDMQRARKALRQALLSLSLPGEPLAPITPALWYEFYDYQTPLRPNYPYIHYNPSWNMATYVRINCVWADVDSGICATNATGGIFSSSSSAAVTMQILTSNTTPNEEADDPTFAIRYTTDGTDPTASSPAYVVGAPPVLSSIGKEAVHLRAMAFYNNVATGQITDSVFAGY